MLQTSLFEYLKGTALVSHFWLLLPTKRSSFQVLGIYVMAVSYEWHNQITEKCKQNWICWETYLSGRTLHFLKHLLETLLSIWQKCEYCSSGTFKGPMKLFFKFSNIVKPDKTKVYRTWSVLFWPLLVIFRLNVF